MADLFKPTYTRLIPSDAKIITKNGKRFARLKQKGGRVVTAPILDDGKRCRVESSNWHGLMPSKSCRRCRSIRRHPTKRKATCERPGPTPTCTLPAAPGKFACAPLARKMRIHAIR